MREDTRSRIPRAALLVNVTATISGRAIWFIRIWASRQLKRLPVPAPARTRTPVDCLNWPQFAVHSIAGKTRTLERLGDLPFLWRDFRLIGPFRDQTIHHIS